MPEHKATIQWTGQGPEFLRGRYSREHTWTFDGGLSVPASPSPHVVPAPWSNAAAIDPEEALVAAVSSCHMLTFLWLAAKAGFQIDRYTDQAVGTMTRNADGVPWVSSITLQVRIAYGPDKQPTPAEEDRLHQAAHQQCFIAQSIKATVRVENLHRQET